MPETTASPWMIRIRADGWHGGLGPLLSQVTGKTSLGRRIRGVSEEKPEHDIPRWLEKAVTSAMEQGVSWLTWWSSHNVDQCFQFHSFEYGLGLLTTDNRMKPQGQVFKRIADAYRGRPGEHSHSALPAPPWSVLSRPPGASCSTGWARNFQSSNGSS